MPIFKKPNKFSTSFNKKSPFRKDEISDFERFAQMGKSGSVEKSDKEWKDPYNMEENIKKYSTKSKKESSPDTKSDKRKTAKRKAAASIEGEDYGNVRRQREAEETVSNPSGDKPAGDTEIVLGTSGGSTNLLTQDILGQSNTPAFDVNNPTIKSDDSELKVKK
tara:strand:- start:26 stop:517 length:492 start_codon:yes stop_codon:yes gene_type:complete